jgi:hypothetical protein
VLVVSGIDDSLGIVEWGMVEMASRTPGNVIVGRQGFLDWAFQ